jgi:AcrR family transcriptional regulator
MTAANIDRMPEERRRRLVRTAAAEFSGAGYEGASLNRIIESCGLSKSSFYHFIASKEELFALVVSDLSRTLVGEVQAPAPEAFSGEDFWEIVDRLFDRLTVALQSDEAYAALGRMFYLSGPSDGSAVSRPLASVEAWVQAVLAIGRESGTVRQDLPVGLQSRIVFAVLRAFDEWSVQHLDTIPVEQWPELMAAQKTALRRLLATEATAPAGV